MYCCRDCLRSATLMWSRFSYFVSSFCHGVTVHQFAATASAQSGLSVPVEFLVGEEQVAPTGSLE